jgi:DNA polymerase III subunit gamma/tau
MAYEVLARKYRPQTFADIVGQAHLVTTLSNAIRAGRVAHAYLFVGPRGTARRPPRIFAKALNCREGHEPASRAPRATPARRSPPATVLDVIEIDGASNNGVEQVRDLRDSARFLPARSRSRSTSSTKSTCSAPAPSTRC